MARKRFNFWLDDNRADDWTVNELITSLKKKGQFTRAIREGLRLWNDLQAGNTTVLCELFPAFKDKLNPPAAPAGNGGVGGSDLAKQIAEQIVLMNGTGGYLMQSAQPSPAPKAGNLPAVPVAVAVKAAPPDADTMADNFLGMLSMFD